MRDISRGVIAKEKLLGTIRDSENLIVARPVDMKSEIFALNKGFDEYADSMTPLNVEF